MGGFWVVLGRLGGGLKKLCGPISKDLGFNAGKGWEELGRIGTAGQKVGESCGKPKKSVAAHTFVQSCAFRSPARSGLIPSWPSWKPLGQSWGALGRSWVVFGRTCVRSGVLTQFF